MSQQSVDVLYTIVRLQRNFLVIVRCSKGIQVFASITAYNPAWFSTDPSEKLWSQKMDVGHKFFPPLLLLPAPCHDDIHLYHTPILVRSDNGIGWQCWLRQVKSYRSFLRAERRNAHYVHLSYLQWGFVWCNFIVSSSLKASLEMELLPKPRKGGAKWFDSLRALRP